jgi:TolB-like protein
VIELKERRVFQMAAAYAIAGWLLLQVGNVFVEPNTTPGWVMNTLVLTVVSGFPIALIGAWAFQLTPSGITLDFRGKQRSADSLDNTEMMIIGLLIITASFFLALSLKIVARQFTSNEAAVEGAIGVPTLSIGVLPFVNQSGGDEDEYFSDGLTEEVIKRLAGVEGLSVAGRTSSFSFTDTKEGARSIASRLAVSFLLSGSVRRAGNQNRILAELVDRNGKLLWSDSYEFAPNVDEVFAAQDAIANDIVARIAPALAVETGDQTIVTEPPTRSSAAYELVLQGRFHLQRRDEPQLRRAIALFQQALDLDDEYVDAYVGLAGAYALLPYYSFESVQSSFDMAMTTIEKGAKKSPEVDDATSGIMAFIHFNGGWRWIESEISFRRALEKSPNDPDLMQWHSQFLGGVGQAQAALEAAIRAKELDPLSPVINQRLAIARLWASDNEAAKELFGLAAELGMPETTNPEPYMILLLRMGEYETARSLMAGMQAMLGFGNDWIDPVFAAIRDQDLRAEAVAAVIEAEQKGQIAMRYLFGAWLYLDETDRAIDIALSLVKDRPSFSPETLFIEEAGRLRSNPRFAELVRAIGLDRYWDNFGWPELCKRVEEEIVCS